ncbi:hypothetical protein DSO57_1029175 [Entomophthora muscae]|uniref:Uncharacterized protein n=1 Tax=Entomophthora muscae TaxID=34485 RepID=A0ACC2RSC1_9FUNG|nr:hypothetical protein DSO57_1029175 [Entomophthora muscae]
MKSIFLVWAFCVLISHEQANVNFETPEPNLTDKSEDSIWYCFGPQCCHAPYVETAQFPPIIHPKAPWLVLGYTSVYYLLNHFSPFLGRFRLFGHLFHMLMIGIPVVSTLVKFNLGALLNSIGERLPNEWIPDRLEHLQTRLIGKVCDEEDHPHYHTTVKELTRAYKELCLHAPSDMGFDNPATHLMYYDVLKPHMMRNINLCHD